jgi:hypothetical protein
LYKCRDHFIHRLLLQNTVHVLSPLWEALCGGSCLSYWTCSCPTSCVFLGRAFLFYT